MKRLILSTAFAASVLHSAAAQTPDQSMVAHLMTVGAFVKDNCTEIEPNTAMLAAIASGAGVDLGALMQDQNIVAEINRNMVMLKAHVAQSCVQAKEMFGPNGTRLPGLMLKK